MFRKLFEMFEKENEQIFIVGGFVRDYFDAQWKDDLDKCNKVKRKYTGESIFWDKVNNNEIDIDFATSAHPEKIIEILEKNNLKVIPIGIEYGTIQTIFKEKKVEITTFRCEESYKKGSRKPSVVFGTKIEEDLLRRDFTFNAMAMKKNAEIIDLYDGKACLIQGLIMTPGEPDDSFSDDPLRMLRGYRFEARGCGSLAWAEGKSIEKNKKLIHDVSVERIFEEFTKILMSPRAHVALKHMADSGLLTEIFPEFDVVINFNKDQGKHHDKSVFEHILKAVEKVNKINPMIVWSTLFHDIGKPQTYFVNNTGPHFYDHNKIGSKLWKKIADRLKVSNDFRSSVASLIYEHMAPLLLMNAKASDKALRKFIVRIGNNLDNLFELTLADALAHKEEGIEERIKKLNIFKDRVYSLINTEDPRKIKLPTGLGKELSKALNKKPGPWIGKVMKRLTEDLVSGKTKIDDDLIWEGIKIHEREIK